MHRSFTKFALAAVATLALGGAAQATEVNISITSDRDRKSTRLNSSHK
jgi:hypothetical protein